MMNESSTQTLVSLESQTNSCRAVPAYALVDPSELNPMIEWAGKIIQSTKDTMPWDEHARIHSLKLSTLPLCEFRSADGNEWEGSRWEQIVTDVSSDGATLIFVHSDTGDELFFEYQPKAFE